MERTSTMGGLYCYLRRFERQPKEYFWLHTSCHSLRLIFGEAEPSLQCELRQDHNDEGRVTEPATKVKCINWRSRQNLHFSVESIEYMDRILPI
jgi:hypothetical protein